MKQLLTGIGALVLFTFASAFVAAAPIDLVGGDAFLCVLDTAGIQCFGDGVNGWLRTDQIQVKVDPVGDAPGAGQEGTFVLVSSPQAIWAGPKAACAEDGAGQVLCWGEASWLNGNLPPFSHPHTVHIYDEFLCADTDEGSLCWDGHSPPSKAPLQDVLGSLTEGQFDWAQNAPCIYGPRGADAGDVGDMSIFCLATGGRTFRKVAIGNSSPIRARWMNAVRLGPTLKDFELRLVDQDVLSFLWEKDEPIPQYRRMNWPYSSSVHRGFLREDPEWCTPANLPTAPFVPNIKQVLFRPGSKDLGTGHFATEWALSHSGQAYSIAGWYERNEDVYCPAFVAFEPFTGVRKLAEASDAYGGGAGPICALKEDGILCTRESGDISKPYTTAFPLVSKAVTRFSFELDRLATDLRGLASAVPSLSRAFLLDLARLAKIHSDARERLFLLNALSPFVDNLTSSYVEERVKPYFQKSLAENNQQAHVSGIADLRDTVAGELSLPILVTALRALPGTPASLIAELGEQIARGAGVEVPQTLRARLGIEQKRLEGLAEATQTRAVARVALALISLIAIDTP